MRDSTPFWCARTYCSTYYVNTTHWGAVRTAPGGPKENKGSIIQNYSFFEEWLDFNPRVQNFLFLLINSPFSPSCYQPITSSESTGSFTSWGKKNSINCWNTSLRALYVSRVTSAAAEEGVGRERRGEEDLFALPSLQVIKSLTGCRVKRRAGLVLRGNSMLQTSFILRSAGTLFPWSLRRNGAPLGSGVTTRHYHVANPSQQRQH